MRWTYSTARAAVQLSCRTTIDVSHCKTGQTFYGLTTGRIPRFPTHSTDLTELESPQKRNLDVIDQHERMSGISGDSGRNPSDMA
jgi:hypothetical protein